MEEVYAILYAVLDEHPLGIALNQLGGRALQLVGHE